MWEFCFDLPDSVRSTLPLAAQSRFRVVANASMARGLDAHSALRKAWAAVGNGWEKPEDGKRWVRKAQIRTLYMRRDVVNAKEIIKWAKEQGFETTLPPDEMHVTIAFSKTPVDWIRMGTSSPYGSNPKDGEFEIPPGGPRVVEPLGPNGAIVLLFSSSELQYRNESMRNLGASWDWPSYQPHISITYAGLPAGLDLNNIEPYQGPIILGPEIFEEIKEDAIAGIVEKVGARHTKGEFEQLQDIHDQAVALGAKCGVKEDEELRTQILKVDRSLGLVFGWAVICKRDGADYYDLNRDLDGSRTPEHITEPAMLEAAADFMEHSRVAKDMHNGEGGGTFIFAFPLTTDIAKAMGISTRVTGLMVAMKPTASLLEKFADGTYTGFSIGGKKIQIEDIDHG